MKRSILLTLALSASALAQLQREEMIKVGVESIGIEKMLGGPHKGAPYSATILNESVQTLADGNRIVNKTTAFVARDSQGRLRMEMTPPQLPGLKVSSKAPRIVMINDNVAGESYSLDLEAKTYTKRALGPQRTLVTASGGEAKAKAEAEAKVKARTGAPNPRLRLEEIGTKVVEGVRADGFRSVNTIPAGDIGNEKPIEVVNESWVSSELNALISSKTIDPRKGEMTTQMTNISRVEPASTLFTIPADFTERKEDKSVVVPMVRYKANE